MDAPRAQISLPDDSTGYELLPAACLVNVNNATNDELRKARTFLVNVTGRLFEPVRGRVGDVTRGADAGPMNIRELFAHVDAGRDHYRSFFDAKLQKDLDDLRQKVAPMHYEKEAGRLKQAHQQSMGRFDANNGTNLRATEMARRIEEFYSNVLSELDHLPNFLIKMLDEDLVTFDSALEVVNRAIRARVRGTFRVALR
uniref:Uncharacterized protein n=1 Tax=Hemiselmis tepida TaxID=464990 RepID=A0A7S0W2L2_9CRYP|mmetsp:Transcript_37803/g.96632  ORF Transcript_37803/g.96632 Transcript_37803/m.96632 type:complete len:199 (+) Transcript_37803:98-694(+)